jgi:amino acid transporter
MSSEKIREVSLNRGMGFWQIWALGVGTVVGDGVFLYMAEGIEKSGPASMVGFFLAGVVQMLIMVSMGEISVGMPSAGAMSDWVQKYLGKFCGLLSGITFSIGWVVIGGSVSIALGRFSWYWVQDVMSMEAGTILFAAIFFSIFVTMNIVGATIAGKGQLIMVIMLVAIMGVFGIGGIFRGVHLEYFVPFNPFGMKGISAVVPIATYAYMGACSLCTAGSECKNPRDLGKALVWSSITFIVIYTLALFVVLGMIRWETVNTNVSPFTQAAELMFGPVAGTIMNFAAWLAAATTLIMGTIYTPSRIFYSMAKEGYFPKFFAKVNAKTKTPVRGIIVIWAVGIAGILAAYYVGAMEFYATLSNQAVIAWMISWGLAIIAGIMFRREMGVERIKKEVGWKQPLFPVIPVIALAGCAYVLYLSFYDIWQLVCFAIWFGVYALYYLFIRKRIKAGKIRSDVTF